MKQLLLFSSIFLFGGQLLSQEWKTIRLNTSAGLNIFPPSFEFKINPYTNDLWFLHAYKASCLEANGDVHFLDLSEYPTWEPDITFTQASPYFRNAFSGLYKINSDYSKTLVYTNNGVRNVSSNEDTIYMGLGNSDGCLNYTSNGSSITYIPFERVFAKGSVKYPAFSLNGTLSKYTTLTADGYEPYSSIDNEYICGQFHDAKFSRLTDTFYVSCTSGISKAINYDFKDSIVPENTLNMPAANVIEFEFDHLDRLWAVFGDATNKPFAIARLDGNEWTNKIDASNSPINFAEYKGLEIDTLGNLWISERFYLHTIITPDSPEWLGTKELVKGKLEIYPNPATATVTLNFPVPDGQLVITTLAGTVMKSEKAAQEQLIDVSQWPQGCYIASWTDGTQKMEGLIVK